MKSIIKSLVVITGLAVIVATSTGAFFSDRETAVGNTFTAGAIDLKVDNESYYNGAVSEHTTFGPSDLDNGLLFFDFNDLKPDDEGEDTISLHVNNNDSWLCMDMSLTSDDDISSNEPELKTGDPENTDDAWDGELGGLLEMIWWVDDGDNVLEEGESLLNGGVKTVGEFFGEDNVFTADLADATTNVWTGEPGPVIGGKDYFIAKAWCYGDLSEARVPQDGFGKTGTNGPLSERGTGVVCDGKALGNESQTDGLTMNIAFRAEQARNNAKFTCGEEVRFATITVVKTVINDNGGNNEVPSFQLLVGSTPVTSGFAVQVNPGAYEISEQGAQGYEATYGGDCDEDGNITLTEGESYTCTIENDDIQPNITLIKNVINDNGGTALATDFRMRVNGTRISSGSSKSFNSNLNLTITEDAFSGYVFQGPIACHSASRNFDLASLGAVITLNEGEQMICEITNNDIAI